MGEVSGVKGAVLPMLRTNQALVDKTLGLYRLYKQVLQSKHGIVNNILSFRNFWYLRMRFRDCTLAIYRAPSHPQKLHIAKILLHM